MADGIYRFPEGFLWGTATAAHHVEGHMNNSWSHWEAMETGAVFKKQKNGRACEWWDGRWVEDFDRMQYLGHNTHRLSVEWSRIQPEPDKIDESALQKYREMLEGLQKRGMRPMVTLHHFTNPMWLENEGGWLANSTVDRFIKFTEMVVDALGDLNDFWCTFNEPMVYAVQAYLVAMFYPGKRNPFKMYRCAELMLRAHAGAYQIIKSRYPNALVGVAKHLLKIDPLPPKIVNGLPIKLVESVFHRAFIEAMVTGELRLPLRKTVVIPNLAGTYDYAGLNFYQRYRGGFAPLSPKTFFLKQVPDDESPPSPPMWGEIYPQGTFERINYIWNVMRKPIYITETGTPDEGDNVRPWYIARMVHSVWQAINFNVPVRGIYYWTLLDNFEWTAGYNPQFRFGLYATNFETQERTIRQSGEFFREISLANGLSSEMVRKYVPQLEEKLFPGSHGQREVKLPSRG